MASALARHQKMLGPFKRRLTTRRTVLSMAPLPIGSCMAMSLAYAMRLWFLTTLFLNSGVLVSGVVREGHWPFKAIEKEGLQEGKHDNNEAGRPRHIHDPGSQQEPTWISLPARVVYSM